MSIIYGTGFEMGTFPVPASARSSGSITMSTSIVKTGNYSLGLLSSTTAVKGYVGIDISGLALSQIYISLWGYVSGGAGAKFYMYLTDGTYVGLRFDGSHWDAYVNGALVANGSIAVGLETWHNIQLYISISDVGGRIVSKINGLTDIDYTGDTKPSTGTNFIFLYLAATDTNILNYNFNVDDLTMDDTDYPNDIRYQVVIPDGDTATIEWTPSTGGTNYNLVDEIPANDTDYVYTDTNGLQDLYTLASFDGTDKTIQVVSQWVRAKKDTSDPQQVKMLLYSGSTLSTGSALNLSSSEYYYFNRIFETNPDTTLAWTESDINNLQIGIESVI